MGIRLSFNPYYNWLVIFTYEVIRVKKNHKKNGVSILIITG